MTLRLKKIREYRVDDNTRPSQSISFMPAVATTSGRLHCELVRILFLQAHWETAFLLLQEFSLGNITRTRFVSAALLSTPTSNRRLATSSPRLQQCVSTLTSMALLWLHAHTLTPPTHKPLASRPLPSS
jgi:hypothetical protein